MADLPVEESAVLSKAAGYYRKAWKDRLMVLCFDEARYFRNVASPDYSKPDHVINLNNCTCHSSDMDPTQEEAEAANFVNDGTHWKIVALEGDDRTKQHAYYFRSPTPEEAQAWIASISIRSNYPEEFPLCMIGKVLPSGMLALVSFVLLGHWSTFTAMFVDELIPFLNTNIHGMVKGVKKNEAVYSRDFGKCFTRHYRFHNNYLFCCITHRKMSVNRVAEFLAEVHRYISGQKLHNKWSAEKKKELESISEPTPDALRNLQTPIIQRLSPLSSSFQNSVSTGFPDACLVSFDVMRMFSPTYDKQQVLMAIE